jgi:hypothetical protein
MIGGRSDGLLHDAPLHPHVPRQVALVARGRAPSARVAAVHDPAARRARGAVGHRRLRRPAVPGGWPRARAVAAPGDRTHEGHELPHSTEVRALMAGSVSIAARSACCSPSCAYLCVARDGDRGSRARLEGVHAPAREQVLRWTRSTTRSWSVRS